jgi:P4 family phage/plasmid primase-like protien
MSDRDTIHRRLSDAGLSDDRYIDVEDGSKRSYDHDHTYSEPPTGNYGIYGKPTDGLVLVDIDDYEELDDKAGLAALADLPATLEQESAHGGTHKLYRVGATDDGALIARVFEDTFGTMNPNPSWGEVRVANQYIVGAGSQLDDGCQYTVQADREVATIAADDLVDVLAADPQIEREDIEPDPPDADESVTFEDDDERLEFALEHDDKLDRLWRGDYSDYGGDRSRAESALAMKLAFWFEKDKRTVRQLMDRARTKKWADRDDDSYRDSVLSAVDAQTDMFEPEQRPVPERSAAAEAAEGTTEADGGAASAPATNGEIDYSEPSLEEQVRRDVLTPLDPPEDYEGEQIDLDVALDRLAQLLCEEFYYLTPRADVQEWRSTIYRYIPDDGIYEPHGERHIEEQVERLLGPLATNQRCREVVGKVERRTIAMADGLKTDPHRRVVQNGIVDLHTGELDEHTPHEPNQTMVPVAYDPDAECPRIDAFFHEIVPDDDVDTLYRLIAHALYGEYVTGKAAMLLGDGQNGKSVFLSLVEEFLGEFNVSHRALQDFDNNDFAANELQGKLANVHPDMSDESVSELGTFKKLTGQDTLTADVKYENPITFENRATLIFAANRMPVLDEDTHALWRRWIYVNFPYRFDDADPDAKDETPKRVLMRELTDESELRGLLARCVEEIREWWDGRAWYPAVADPETVREKMKRASEPVYDFAAVCLTAAGDDTAVPKDDMRAAYREYARQENLPARSDNVLGEKLLNLRDFPIEDGRQRIDGERVTVYKGVAFTPRGRQCAGYDGVDDPDQSAIDDGGPRARAETIVEVVDRLDDGNGVRKDMILAGAQGQNMSKLDAQKAFEKALRQGLIMEMQESHYRTT